MKLPVARCGVDGCGTRIAWIRLREPDELPVSADLAGLPEEWGDDGWIETPPRYPNLIATQRLNRLPENAGEFGEKVVRQVSEGWLVGWCKRNGHGPRYVRAADLWAALESGETTVTATDEPV